MWCGVKIKSSNDLQPSERVILFTPLESSMKTLSVDMSTALLNTKKSHGQSSTSNCKDQAKHLRGYFDKMEMICIFGIIKYDILWLAVPEDSLTRMTIRVESWMWCRGKSLVRVEQGRGDPRHIEHWTGWASSALATCPHVRLSWRVG